MPANRTPRPSTRTLASTGALLLALLAPAAAQSSDPAVPFHDGTHRHDGFYLSLNAGSALGGMILDARGSAALYRETILRGAGAMIDLKIGGAIRDNLVLSFDLITRVVSGPEVVYDGVTAGDASDDFRLIDNIYGVGLTRYFMPHNLFVSGTLGFGKIVIDNDGDEASSKWGPALQAKVGKEWWVGRNWGLGLSGGYGVTFAKDRVPPGADYKGDLASHRFFVLFNSTYN